MIIFDKMNQYGLEIDQNDSKCNLRYFTGDHVNSIDILEISSDDAKKIIEAYSNVEGKMAIRQANEIAERIILHYQNKRS